MFQPVCKSENGGDDAISLSAEEYLRDCPHLEAVYYAHWCLDEQRPASAELLDVLRRSARSRFGYRGNADRAALADCFNRLAELRPGELDAVAHAVSGEDFGDE